MSRAAGTFSRARRAVFACLALACAGAVPASGADAPVWYDAHAAVPATVTLNAVATNGTTVVAVGADGSVPVAYALTGDAWTRSVLAPEGTSGSVADVAVDEHGRGWAVGWQRTSPDAPVHALLERLAPDGTWKAVSTGDAPALTAVAASADLAYAGDVSGAIRPLDDNGLGAPLSWAAPGTTTAVRSLALTSGLSAIGGGTPDSGAPAATALLDIDGASGRVTQSPAVPADGGSEIVSVAALPDGHRIALDGTVCGTAASGAPGAWLPDATTGAWRRDSTFPAGSAARACDAAFTPAGDALVAGSFDGHAAVWRHGSAGWVRSDDLAPGELRGIAATADGAWAVGAAGTVLRYGIPPAPPHVDPDPGTTTTTADPQPDTDTAPPASDPQPDSSAPQADTAPTSGASQPPPASSPAVAVSVHTDPASEPVVTRRRPQSRPVPRMLSRLAVRRLAGHRLQLRFRLRLPARLEVRALRGTKVVGRASRHLRAGAHQLIVSYRGTTPPTRLDIVVRRAKPGASKENPR